MSRSGSNQTVKVDSNPPGALVRVRGRDVGHTPVFIEVQRSRQPTVQIGSKNAANGFLDVQLETRYRFRRSLLGGLAFLTWAPVAWITDLVTGTAWEARDPEPIAVELTDADREWTKRQLDKKTVAIAPPLGDSMLLSDVAADRLEETFRSKGTSTLLPYRSTLPTFLENDYEFDERPSDKRNLYRELAVDQVVESEVTNDGDGWKVQSRVVEPLARATAAALPGPEIRIVAGNRLESFLSGLGWWSRLVPNTFGFDLSNEKITVAFGDQTYDLETIEPDEWWGKGLQYVSSISISNTPPVRIEHAGRFALSAVPLLRLSRKMVRARDLPPPPSGELVERSPIFLRSLAAGGYGVELGYQVRSHYVYFDWIPYLYWSEIAWRQSGADSSATRTGLLSLVEFGYSRFWKSGLVLRLFVRNQPEDTLNWKDAFGARAYLGPIISSSTVVSGFVVAYRFN